MGEIQRPGALYRQVAAAIRDAITAGEFAPGGPLPSEAQLIERYQVSRPTVRNAVAALRAEGLIEVIHGKGSFVRSAPAVNLTIDRSVTQQQDGGFSAGCEGWELRDEPSVYRTHTDATTGPLLDLEEGEALFATDRLWADPKTGVRVAHRLLIPFATAEGTALADHPDTTPENAYQTLTQAGHTLWWSETARARMPLPDERTTLNLPDATPILQTLRVTYGQGDRPLLLEDLRAGGDRTQTTYGITTTTPQHLNAVHD